VVVNKTPDSKSTALSSGLVPDDDAVPTRLMVFGLTHRDGTLPAAELYRVAAECGIAVETVRSCMRRLVTEGIFLRSGEGKDAIFTATDAGRSVLSINEQRHLLAYAQDAAGRGWDRRWRMVCFAIPESHRTARDTFRDHVLSLGGAAVQPGVYVSPHRWQGDITAEAERLGILSYVSTYSTDDLCVGGEGDARALAGQLWQLENLSRQYQAFIETYRGVPEELSAMRQRGQLLTEHDFLPGVLHIAIRFNECFELDPLLPPELLPKPWPGREARKLLAGCRKHGVLARNNKSGPVLFSVFDDAIAHLP